MAKTVVQEFTKGLWDEIPPFRLVLGLCPTLAVTKSVENGIGMGLAFTFVLVCSNMLVSALRKVIPPKVRIACYIIIIATFVTVVELLMQAYTYMLFQKLGIFIPLIVVNCIVLGRAEAFASKKGIVAVVCRCHGHGDRFYPVAGVSGHPAGNVRQRNHYFRFHCRRCPQQNRHRFDGFLGQADPCVRGIVRTLQVHGRSAGRLCMPGSDAVHHESFRQEIGDV